MRDLRNRIGYRFWYWRWQISLRLRPARQWLGRLWNCHRNARRLAAIEQALNHRDLFINPDFMEEIAGEIDCAGSGCEHVWSEWDTGASGCTVSEKGTYCPNDLAETLRELARVARA
ncbi:MAG: hypothetical protein J0I54_17785 [Bosea sp.]|uniref:hypothetical protein n=1 Tax=unclassified Bosea (in: a-proteobacteria) TaxID=2653178 RepID=UPI0009616B09|nr:MULTISPECIES: hypothetical protein [unclassified Bosea (in: a-proteobacteria)]MBN9458485.1 hypothetical protein [Bosea sp. (in: a-proteobacteria)]OJV06813.1 MAG: hypothetical protein BGO20_00160 [Bosea sp. 67-29]